MSDSTRVAVMDFLKQLENPADDGSKTCTFCNHECDNLFDHINNCEKRVSYLSPFKFSLNNEKTLTIIDSRVSPNTNELESSEFGLDEMDKKPINLLIPNKRTILVSDFIDFFNNFSHVCYCIDAVAEQLKNGQKSGKKRKLETDNINLPGIGIEPLMKRRKLSIELQNIQNERKEINKQKKAALFEAYKELGKVIRAMKSIIHGSKRRIELTKIRNAIQYELDNL